jgi:hypothetical protein
MPTKQDLVMPMLHRLAKLGIVIPKSSIEDFLTRQAKLVVNTLRSRMHPGVPSDSLVDIVEPKYNTMEELLNIRPALDYNPNYYAPSAFFYIEKRNWSLFLESVRMDLLQYIYEQPNSCTIRFLRVKVVKSTAGTQWKCY